MVWGKLAFDVADRGDDVDQTDQQSQCRDESDQRHPPMLPAVTRPAANMGNGWGAGRTGVPE